MGLSFYKPNPRVTGHGCNFEYREEAVLASFIKQSGWDDSTKKGSFKASQGNPEKNTTIKLSLTEVAGMLDAFANNSEFKAFHRSPSGTTAQITLAPYMKEGQQVGFSLVINRTNTQGNTVFLIGFTFPESTLVKRYLEWSLGQAFAFLTPVRENTQKPVEEAAPTPAPAPTQESQDQDLF